MPEAATGHALYSASVPPWDRQRVQLAARLGGLAFVVAWLFSARLQGPIPFWLPFLILAATELEFLARGWRQPRAGRRPRATQAELQRRLPGKHDADLGWVEIEGEDGEPTLVAAPPAPRREVHRARHAIGVVLAVALFVVALRTDTRDTWSSLAPEVRTRSEQRFSREAQRIAGRPVTVACDDGYAFTGVGSDASGVAFPRRGLAFLEPDVCRTLHDIVAGRTVRSREDAAWAITVLAHEATHLRGIRDEAQTECYALQEGVGLGARLGFPPTEARSLMRAQLDRDLSTRSVERLDYRLPPECRDGGDLDLRPGQPSFP